ncbi:unnamed protein product [Malus baccata var. baccata]
MFYATIVRDASIFVLESRSTGSRVLLGGLVPWSVWIPLSGLKSLVLRDSVEWPGIMSSLDFVEWSDIHYTPRLHSEVRNRIHSDSVESLYFLASPYSLLSCVDPGQASKHNHWKQAMLEEFQALQSTGTWTLVPSSPHHNLIGYKWVFRIKRKPDGSVESQGFRSSPLLFRTGSSQVFIRKYELDLLLKTKMEGCKPCSTPLGSQKLDHVGSPLSNPHEYRSIVGALQYLTWTRPDLSFAVNQVCQFLYYPRDTHYQAVKRILGFLKGFVDQGLWFRKSPLHLTAFSDAGCVYDRHLTSGYCVYLGSKLISWSAKKQSIVARSSIEVEYHSLAHTGAEITWYVPTQHKIDDIHTKALSKARFKYLQSKLRISSYQLKGLY